MNNGLELYTLTEPKAQHLLAAAVRWIESST